MEIKKKNIVKSLLLSSLALGLFVTANNNTVNASSGSNVTSEKVTNTQKTITIQTGDTVSAYAVKYNSTVKDIADLNKLANANLIYAGNKITIPLNSRSAGQSIYDGWNANAQGAGVVQAQPVAAAKTAPVTVISAPATATATATAQVSTAQTPVVPAAEAPAASVAASQASTSQTPASQTPASQTPASQTPASQAPASQTPASQTPASQAPTSQAPASQTPASQTPASQTPASQAPASQTPASQAPASQTPASQAPASQTPASQAPASQTPADNGGSTAFVPTAAGVKAALQAKIASFGKPESNPNDLDQFPGKYSYATFSGEAYGDDNALTSDQQIADFMWENSNGSLLQNSLDQVVGISLTDFTFDLTNNGQFHASFVINVQQKAYQG